MISRKGTHVVVRANSTSGAWIVERARRGWGQSKADVAGCFERSKAEAVARDLNDFERVNGETGYGFGDFETVIHEAK